MTADVRKSSHASRDAAPRPAILLDLRILVDSRLATPQQIDQLSLHPDVCRSICRLTRASFAIVVLTDAMTMVDPSGDRMGARLMSRLNELLAPEEGTRIDFVHPYLFHPIDRSATDRLVPACRSLEGICAQLGLTAAGSWFVSVVTRGEDGVTGSAIKSIYLRPPGGDYIAPPQSRPDFECFDLSDAVEFIIDRWPRIASRAGDIAAGIRPGDLVAIGGLARTGKSTWASALNNALATSGLRTAVISLDGWLHRAERRSHSRTVTERFDMDAIRRFIEWLRGGGTFTVPLYDRQSGACRSSCSIVIDRSDIVIIEGIVALLIADIERFAAHRHFVVRPELARYDSLRADYALRGYSMAEFESLYQSRVIDETPVIERSRACATMLLDDF